MPIWLLWRIFYHWSWAIMGNLYCINRCFCFLFMKFIFYSSSKKPFQEYLACCGHLHFVYSIRAADTKRSEHDITSFVVFILSKKSSWHFLLPNLFWFVCLSDLQSNSTKNLNHSMVCFCSSKNKSRDFWKKSRHFGGLLVLLNYYC